MVSVVSQMYAGAKRIGFTFANFGTKKLWSSKRKKEEKNQQYFQTFFLQNTPPLMWSGAGTDRIFHAHQFGTFCMCLCFTGTPN